MLLVVTASYDLELRTTDRDHVALVDLSGELDLTNASELERRLEEIAQGSSALVLDLNRVLFLDSAALHVLFRVARVLDGEQKRFGIAIEPTAPVARTLTIVGLDEVTSVRHTVDEFLAGPA
jgi:anti-anti-sigma factor